jgi:hypothetical protein
MVAGDKGCEGGVVVYVKDRDRVNMEGAKIWSWQMFRLVWCHTVLSMQMAEVRCVVYWMTVVVGGGSAVNMAC